ncbi:hypothetical protein [Agrobacterium sp. RS6]|uniref:hypothetical protein n=1 Tax=Agrobacterium sp. RS6 TaxID=2489001 RepID=UPI0013E32505|nr:hypothetical protein [Agrobacterium sp. RS6]
MQEKKARIISGGNRIVGRGPDVCRCEELPRLFNCRPRDFSAVVDKVERRVIAGHRKVQDRKPLSLPTDVSEWNEWQQR